MISVKECFYLKNTYSTGGMLTFVSEKDVKNSPAVQTLLNLGAVPFCKTNVPQVVMCIGSSLTSVNEGLSLMIVNETTNFLKTNVFENDRFFKTISI